MEVAKGASKTVDLSDYIEDPDGGALTFAVSDDEGVPTGWGVTTNGAILTFTASENAVNGDMFVTATDPAGECWNFPVRLTVAEVWGAFSGFAPDRRRVCNPPFIPVYVTDRSSQSAARAAAADECERRRRSFPEARACLLFDDVGTISPWTFARCGAVAFGQNEFGCWVPFARGATHSAARAAALAECSHQSCRILASACNSTVAGAKRVEIRATQGEGAHVSDLDVNAAQSQNVPSRMVPRSPRMWMNYTADSRER